MRILSLTGQIDVFLRLSVIKLGNVLSSASFKMCSEFLVLMQHCKYTCTRDGERLPDQPVISGANVRLNALVHHALLAVHHVTPIVHELSLVRCHGV